MKKKQLITAAAAMVLTLTACGLQEQSETSGTNTGAVSSIQTSENTISGQDTAGGAAVDSGQTSGAQTSAAGSDTSSNDEPIGDIIADEDADAADNSGADAPVQDSWSGSYIGDDETVSIALLDSSALSFSFAQSGISGTASVNGLQAVYNGDDHYVVVFNLNGDILEVSVSNEEDYDASESPLNGTYLKE